MDLSTRRPTALLSVFDKTGIVDLAAGLHELGWRILASGGTAAAVSAAGVPVTDVAEITGVPAILDHRVVTLHPRVHGGLLADPTDEGHRADMAAYGIEPIQLVVVGIPPFATHASIDAIDVGGPAMIRAAAKNHLHVGVVVRTAEYGPVLDEIRRDGALSLATRRRLARDAFATISAYDTAIASWIDDPRVVEESLPPGLHLSLERAQTLRYGENPHQQGARYRVVGRHGWPDAAVVHQGKPLSYLNMLDADAAWRLVNHFAAPASVIVKHTNPCGVAVAGDILAAHDRALACDPTSAFGGVVALNRAIDVGVAEVLVTGFIDVLIAPDCEQTALEVLARRPSMRVLSAPPPSGDALHMRSLDGGMLVQQIDTVSPDRSAWRVVTRVEPTPEQWSDLEFAWSVCAAVSSNAIVYARQLQAVGIGAGQQNRLDAARIAADRAAGRAAGGVCASDAFFPFRDGLDAAASAGVAAVIQPGGSRRDDEVIAAADEHGIAMVFTGERHFRH
ncbi:MAG: bifunctional phosphoribosylaminoimidazolecarboxamide formyltransferase/IMP cyclohydrolase [Ilumatobacteraceae bacterium]